MNTKIVLQLDAMGYIIGLATADESPLEPGVFLPPGGCVDSLEPEVPEGHRAKWNGATFDIELIPVVVDPEPDPVTPPPMVVTMRQARLALAEAGKLNDVQPAIDALPEPTKTVATIEWEYSQDVARDWAVVVALGPALGLSEADLDSLFARAATL